MFNNMVAPLDMNGGGTPYKVCTTWTGQFKDAGFGESVAATTSAQQIGAIAADARIIDINNAGFEVWHGYLDSNGCVPNVGLTPGRYYSLVQGSTLTLPDLQTSQNPHPALSIGYSPSWQTVQYWNNGTVASATKYMLTLATSFVPTGSGGTISLQPNALDTGTDAAFVASEIFLTGDNGLTDNNNILVYSSDPCQDSSSNGSSCYAFGLGIAYLGPILDANNSVIDTNAHWKYVAAHEMGHGVQDQNMGSPGLTELLNLNGDAGIYPRTCTPQLCDCTQVPSPPDRGHCLQSCQADETGQAEGWAHFYSQKIWNAPSPSSCTFVYYKHFLQPDGGKTPPPFAVSCAQNVQWDTLNCENPPGSPLSIAGTSVEYDWLEFLHGTNNAPNPFTISNVFATYQNACGNADCSWSHEAFAYLVTAAQNLYNNTNPLAVRQFTSAGNNAGVNN
jgi:hypothetical protein